MFDKTESPMPAAARLVVLAATALQMAAAAAEPIVIPIVPIALPPGTDTWDIVIPPGVPIPTPPPEPVNPLGLSPGFYSINLGQCFGANVFSSCQGAFLTHAAPKESTAGIPKQVSPNAAAADLFGGVFGTGDSGPPKPAPTTMPGWSLFTMTFPSSQQALSVADFESTIEMPLGQSFSSPSSFFPDYRTHWFSRSEDYSVLKVGFPAVVDTSNAPFEPPRVSRRPVGLSQTRWV